MKRMGNARIYMPQATYGDNKYIVPNDGTATQHNLNYAVSGDRVNIFLEFTARTDGFEAYSVKISSGDAGQSGYTHYRKTYLRCRRVFSCNRRQSGKTFYLSVDLNF